MKSHNVRADAATTEVALITCAKGHQWEHAVALLKQMQSQNMKPSAAAFDSTIASCMWHLNKQEKFWRFPASQGCWGKVLSMLQEMRDEGFEPSVDSYDAAVTICEAIEDKSEATRLQEEMDTLHFRRLLATCERHGRWEKALSLLQTVRDQGNRPPDQQAHVSAIGACGRVGRWKRALAVLNSLREQGVTPSVEVFHAALEVCTRLKQSEAVTELHASMRLSGLATEIQMQQTHSRHAGGLPSPSQKATYSLGGLRRQTVAFDTPALNEEEGDQDAEGESGDGCEDGSAGNDRDRDGEGEGESSEAEMEAVASAVVRSKAFEEQWKAFCAHDSTALQKYLEACDIDKDGKISMDEFVESLSRAGLHLANDQQGSIASTFALFDADDSGLLNVRELARFLRQGVGAVISRRLKAAAECRVLNERRMRTRKVMERIGVGIAMTSGHPQRVTMIESGEGRFIDVKDRTFASLREVWARGIDKFKSWDVDARGTVGKEEFRRAMLLLGVRGLKPDDVDTLFDIFDEDDSGDISYKELAKAIRPQFRPRAAVPVARDAAGSPVAGGRFSSTRSPSPGGGRRSPNSPLGRSPSPSSRASPSPWATPRGCSPVHVPERPGSRSSAPSPALSGRPASVMSSRLASSRAATPSMGSAAQHGSRVPTPFSSPSSRDGKFLEKEIALRMGREKLEPLLHELRGLQDSMRNILPKHHAFSAENAAFLRLNFGRPPHAAAMQNAEEKAASTSPKLSRRMSVRQATIAVRPPESLGGVPAATPRAHSIVPMMPTKSLKLSSENPSVIASLEAEELTLLKRMEELEAQEQALTQRRRMLSSLPAGSRYCFKNLAA
mmetsp:Transcript_17669/g.61847  ORF Transcript_17669/g.61847 Transcript_17669/m.61847 type:complete len:841 (-) Transcript_17669:209-2731(-)